MNAFKKIFESTTFPILINSFNRPTYLKLMVEEFNKINYLPIVLDNNSTNKELLEYYEKNNKKKFILIRFDKDYGNNIIYSNELYYNLPDYFAYTDCDLKLNHNLPKNFIEILCKLTDEFSTFKAGFALQIHNIKLKNIVNKKIKRTIKDWEKNYWTKPLKHNELEIYSAKIDTTFAVYNKKNDNLPGAKSSVNSIRVAGNFTAVHLPWIVDDPMPKSEEKFYLNSDKLKVGGWHNDEN